MTGSEYNPGQEGGEGGASPADAGRAATATQPSRAVSGKAGIPDAGRSADNCPFYPACYIAGDCNRDSWRTGDCGLPKDTQQQKRDEWLRGLVLRCNREKIAQQLSAEARRGKWDHLLPKQGTEAGTDETQSGSARQGDGPVAKPCAQGGDA